MPHVTEKELLMINEDLLEHETIIEKYGCYLREVQDPEIRSVIQRHQGILQQHYQELLGLAQPQQRFQAGFQTFATGYQPTVQGGVQAAGPAGVQSGFGAGSQWQTGPGTWQTR